jgi:hypothetical protein
MLNDLINNSVLLRFRSRHERVAVHVTFDFLQWLAGVLGIQLVELLPSVKDLFGYDLDIGSRNEPAEAAIPMQIVLTGAWICCIVS